MSHPKFINKLKVPLLFFQLKFMLTLSGLRGVGTQRPGGPLTAVNQKPLTYSMMPKISKILAKFIIQGVAVALFSLICPKNLQNEKNFLYLEIVQIYMRDQFCVEKKDSGYKNSFFF